MPDVNVERLRSRDAEPNGADATDEITRIASNVLKDLESFVDESSNDLEDHLEDGDDDDDDANERSTRGIGVSLDELRLILDTSIRHHVGVGGDSPRSHAPVPVTPLSLAPTRTKYSSVSIQKSWTKDLDSSPLSELQQLLRSKQQEFAHMKEQNHRVLERVARWPRTANCGDNQELQYPYQDQPEIDPPRHHRHWQSHDRPPMVSDAASSLSSSSSSSSSFSPKSSLASVHSSTSARRENRSKPLRLATNQATETEDNSFSAPAQRSSKTAVGRDVEKACNVTPSDLGPAITDVPASTALDLSGARSRSVRGRSMRSEDVQSKWSSSSSSSSSSFSSSSSSHSQRSVASQPSHEPHHQSTRRSHHKSPRSRRSSSDGSVHSTEPHQQPTLPAVTMSSIPVPPGFSLSAEPTPSQQLDWELDLSNFNI